MILLEDVIGENYQIDADKRNFESVSCYKRLVSLFICLLQFIFIYSFFKENIENPQNIIGVYSK
jgi:hypothetical protein